MPQHVLLGSSPPEILQAVQLGLESAGHHVSTATDVEGVVSAARKPGIDLVIVAEQLSGGTGSDVCLILQDLPGHAPLLYVGDVLVPGADAFAPEADPGRILEQASTLLEGAELIDSLGDMQKPEPPPAPPAPAPAAAAPDPEDPPKTKKSKAVSPPAPKANGSDKSDRASFDALLKNVRGADYFEILGVAQDAPIEDIRSACESRKQLLDGLGTSVPRPQLEEARAALDEAWDVLSEPALRAAYTRNRP